MQCLQRESGPINQTADWQHHKEECPGHLRKMGMANLEKASGFKADNNHVQALRHAELALTKLKLLKDRPLEDLDLAFSIKTRALRFLGHYRDAMESAKELYSMWAMTNIRHPRSIWAAFELIECCLQLEEYVDAEMFARTAYEIINAPDIIIPIDERQQILAGRGAGFLASAIYNFAKAGGITTEAKPAAGVKAIALTREALEIDTQSFGAASSEVACDMMTLADVLDFFNEVDDDEVLRLYKQANVIFSRAQGSHSPNVAMSQQNLGVTYRDRAIRALRVHDLNRAADNLQLSLSCLREAIRIFRAANRTDKIDEALRCLAQIEEMLRHVEINRAATAESRS